MTLEPGADEQHLGELDACALVRVELLDAHHGTFLDAVLFTARGNHGIHGSELQTGRSLMAARKRAENCTAEAQSVKSEHLPRLPAARDGSCAPPQPARS